MKQGSRQSMVELKSKKAVCYQASKARHLMENNSYTGIYVVFTIPSGYMLVVDVITIYVKIIWKSFFHLKSSQYTQVGHPRKIIHIIHIICIMKRNK